MFWKRIERIERLLERFSKDVDSRLIEIDKTLVKQEVNLQQHMQRSEHLEGIIESMEDKDLKPLRRHVAMMEGALKLIGVIGIVVGILAGIFKILDLI